MRYTTLIFDLDGTLSDPALGVVRCMNFALTSFDQPPRADHEIKRHIGPPLEQILALLSDNDDPAMFLRLQRVIASAMQSWGTGRTPSILRQRQRLLP